MRVGSRATLNGAPDNRHPGAFGAAVAGLPNGAPAPSVLTNDSGSEHFEVNPFPYEAPPGFHTLGINTNVTDTKSPSATATPADALGENPFRDPVPPSPLTTTDTLLSPTGEKGGSRYSSPVVRQPPLRNPQADAWQLSNISHDNLAPPPHAPPPSSQGAVADNVSDDAWHAAAQ